MGPEGESFCEGIERDEAGDGDEDDEDGGGEDEDEGEGEGEEGGDEEDGIFG